LQPEVLERETFDWIFILIILSLSAFAWIRVSFPKRLAEFGTAFFSNRYIAQITREENPFLNISMIVLFLNYLINMSIFIFLLNQSFGLNDLLNDGIRSFLLVLFLLLAFDVIKLFFYWYTASVFKTEQETSVQVLNLMLNRAGLGLFLVLSNLIFAYSGISAQIVSILGVSTVALMFLYRLIKSIPDYHKQGSYPVHYFILYICTLEISPILILGKYFVSV